jgi:hypothetical protein
VSDLENLKIPINKKYIAQLPQLSKNSSTVTLFEQGKSQIPSFIKFFRSNLTLELFPTRISQYDIMIELVTVRGIKSIYKFKVEVLANETEIYQNLVSTIS